MAVTVTDLGNSLRLTTPVVEPELSIITRLLGVSESLVNLYGRNAPSGVQDEAQIRVASYLYDMPTAAAGMSYAVAWRNSGAAALVAPWQTRRALKVGSEAVESSSVILDPGSGVTTAEVAALIAEHQAISDAHHTPGQSIQTETPASWAQQNNNDLLPNSKISSGTPGAGQVPKLDASLVSQWTDLPDPPVSWAQSGDTSLIPAAKYRAPTTTERGAPTGITNAIIDADTSTAYFAWAISHIKRIVNSIVPSWARDNTSIIPETKYLHIEYQPNFDTTNVSWQSGVTHGDLTIAKVGNDVKLFQYSTNTWIERFAWDLAPPVASTVSFSLLATLTATNGTLADFNAVRTYINGGGKRLQLRINYPRTFSTITDGKGYTEVSWDVTETISADIPASSNNDTYLREFASTYSDQSAGPEAVALYIRPGGTNKLSVANSLTAGYEILIYGQD